MARQQRHAGWLEAPEGYDPIGQPDFNNELADYWGGQDVRTGAYGMEYWTGEGYARVGGRETPDQIRAAYAEHLRREMWKQANPEHHASKGYNVRYHWDEERQRIYPTPPPWKDFDITHFPGSHSEIDFKQPWVSDPPDWDKWPDSGGYDPTELPGYYTPIGEPVVNDFPSEEAFAKAGFSPEQRQSFGEMVRDAGKDVGDFYVQHITNKIVRGIIQHSDKHGLANIGDLDVAELPGVNFADRFLINSFGNVTKVGHIINGIDHKLANPNAKEVFKQSNALHGDFYDTDRDTWIKPETYYAEFGDVDKNTDPSIIEDNIRNINRNIVRQGLASGAIEPEGSTKKNLHTFGEALKTWPEADQNEVLDILSETMLGSPSQIQDAGGLRKYINHLNIKAPTNEKAIYLKRQLDSTNPRGLSWFGQAAKSGDLYTPGHEDTREWIAGTSEQKELSKDFWAKNPTAEDVLDIQDALEISREIGNLTDEQAYQTYQQIMGDRKIEQLATGKNWQNTFVRETEQDKINRLRNFQDLLGKGKELVGKAMPALEGQKQLLSGVLKSADDYVLQGSTPEKSAWDVGKLALDEWKQRQTAGDVAGKGMWNVLRGMPGYGTAKKLLTGQDNPGGFQTGPTEAARRALQTSGRLAKVGGNLGASLVAGYLEKNYLDPAAQKAGKWLGEEVLRPIGQAIDDILPGVNSEDERQRLEQKETAQQIDWSEDTGYGSYIAGDTYHIGRLPHGEPIGTGEGPRGEMYPEYEKSYEDQWGDSPGGQEGLGIREWLDKQKGDEPVPGVPEETEPPSILPEGASALYGNVPYELRDQYGTGKQLLGWTDPEKPGGHTWVPTQGSTGPWSGGSWGDKGDNEPVTLHDGTVVSGNAYHNSPLFDAIREYDARQGDAPVNSIPDTSTPSPTPTPTPGTPPPTEPTGPEADFYNPYEGQGDMVFPAVMNDYYHPETGRHYSVGPPMSPKDGSGWVSNPGATYDGKGNIIKQREYPAPPGHSDLKHPQYIDPTKKQTAQPTTPPPTADKPQDMLGQWTKEETEGMMGAGGMVELPDGSWTTGHAWANDKELQERVAAWEKQQGQAQPEPVQPPAQTPPPPPQAAPTEPKIDDWLPEHDFEQGPGDMWLAVMNDWYNPDRRKHYSASGQWQPKEGTGWERNTGPIYDGQGNITTPRKYLKPGDPGYEAPTTPPTIQPIPQPEPPATIQPIPEVGAGGLMPDGTTGHDYLNQPTIQPISQPKPPVTIQPIPEVGAGGLMPDGTTGHDYLNQPKIAQGEEQTPLWAIPYQEREDIQGTKAWIEKNPQENYQKQVPAIEALYGTPHNTDHLKPKQWEIETDAEKSRQMDYLGDQSSAPKVNTYSQLGYGLESWNNASTLTPYMQKIRHQGKKKKKVNPYAPSSGGGLQSMRIGGVNYG